MKKYFLWLAAIIGLLVISGVLLVATGNWNRAFLAGVNLIYAPDKEFDPGQVETAAPDYAELQYWAARPELQDAADLKPDGVNNGPVQGQAPVDVFFVHPTGFMTGTSWTSPMDPNSAAEENTLWSLAHQASAFNGCCNIYAPRYREASIFAYFTNEKTRDAIFDFVYQDVAAAFDYYRKNLNGGRPFILASHSQGTHHSLRLLKEKIAGKPIADRLVAAYLIGGVGRPVTFPYLDSLEGIDACSDATDTHCVVAWDTYGEGGRSERNRIPALCTNPLSWNLDNEKVPKERNIGALVSSWPYNVDLSDDHRPGLSVMYLNAPLPAATWAQCVDHVLYVADQSGSAFASGIVPGSEKSYHGLDYALFYINIRQNAIQRVKSWLARASQDGVLEHE